MSSQTIKIGLAEMGVVQLNGVLKTTGLGSCVGVTLYDRITKTGGMAHIMLPTSNYSRERGGKFNLAKYADTAIPELITQMERLGVERRHLEAKMAGGAQMFTFSSEDTLRIGQRNIESCRQWLQQYNIPLKSEDTGGHYGRTIELHCNTGILYVRQALQGVKVL